MISGQILAESPHVPPERADLVLQFCPVPGMLGHVVGPLLQRIMLALQFLNLTSQSFVLDLKALVQCERKVICP